MMRRNSKWFLNNNYYYYVVSNSKSDDEVEESFFNEEITNEVEATPNTSINAKLIQVMKMLQASYNNDANKTVKEATQGKSVK